MSAYEAHIVEVTATIENSMAVSTEAIDFGNVFPQEQLFSDPFIITPSCSFNDQERVNYIDYVIKQKPVPIDEDATVTACETSIGSPEALSSEEYCLNYSKEEPGFEAEGASCTAEELDYEEFCQPSLCPYLSKEVDGFPGE
ncbi:MAG: hypothetical protein PHU03_05595, partial [Syntrophales bacterium]|nr:hypothetical protein [Syntrophales bacterium]